MRIITHSALLGCLVAGACPAQTAASSPAGYEFVEGSGDQRNLLGTEPRLRYQQIDSTTQSPLLNRGRLMFRRDGHLFNNAQYAARTIEFELVMGEGDITAFTDNFANNIKANAATVLAKKKISFPDWTQAPALPPAANTAVLVLDQPWSYLGKQATGNDWIWEARIYGNDRAGADYPFDFQVVVANAAFGQRAPSRSGHYDLGTGCQVARGESHMNIDVFNYGNKFTLDAHLHSVPNAPVFFTIGFYNANLTHPQLCATVFAVPGIAFPVGPADANGDVDVDIDPIQYDPTWIGLDLYAQAAAPDGSQQGIPVALSSGAKMTIPPDPRGPAVGHLWALDPGATMAAFGPLPGGVIVHTDF